MAGGQEKVLRRRIRTVQATKKITRAFELIAASQIVRAQNRIAGFRPYLKGIAEILAEAAADAGPQRGTRPRGPRVAAARRGRGRRGRPRPVRGLQRQRPASRPSARCGRLQAGGVEHRAHERGPQGPVVLPLPPARARAVVLRVLRPAHLRRRPPGRRRRHPAVPRRGGRPGPDRLDAVPLGRHPGGRDPASAAAARAHLEDGGDDEGPEREGYTEFEPESPDLLVELVPRYVEAACSARCSRLRPASTRRGNGPWPPPPTTPTSWPRP